MAERLSPRLAAVVEALPLRTGMRVLEIGCGPGAAAREVARRVGPTGYVLGVDRSARAVEQGRAGCVADGLEGVLEFRQAAAGEFTLEPGEAPYDLAFAVRVGVLDGRHPDGYDEALRRIRAALTPDGRLFLDGGDPLREVPL